MGQEILHTHFDTADFEAFSGRLAEETRELAEWFRSQAFVQRGGVAGFELEAWLVDDDFLPAPLNERFLKAVNTEWVSPELSQFNVEVNGRARPLNGPVLSQMYEELLGTWTYCRGVARGIGAQLIMVGILPSVREDELTLENMSRMKRYRALNEQVFRQRRGRPLELDILGREHLTTEHHDVMLESATTSFQIHLQVRPDEAVRFYNASIVASAMTVGACGNSPFLFGYDLWDETRIPLFEQAVEVGGFADAAYGPLRRVGFGSGYARESLFEPFEENLEHFPALLPMLFDDRHEGWNSMDHLRLHNGTIWRWNRPLIGFEADGRPHLRIEHRVVPGGPTVRDLVANMALYYGLVQYLAMLKEPPERAISFSQARDNFYAAARNGLDAGVRWLDGRKVGLRDLLLDEILPAARAGLEMLDIDDADINTYLGIVIDRVGTAQTGAVWQRRYVARHGRDMQELTAAYGERQNTEIPVHEWQV